ncbi:hypothetical protein J6590_031512 [Homalodisca vitripennis]|nr:hypothetical protein J6590_031512 [Homalodisca vitripennis]
MQRERHVVNLLAEARPPSAATLTFAKSASGRSPSCESPLPTPVSPSTPRTSATPTCYREVLP